MNVGIYPPSLQMAPPPCGLLGYPSPVPTPEHAGHPDAIDWARRVRVAGGDVSKQTLGAVSQFCAAIDAANLRDRFLRLSLFCGSNLTAALVPLYRGRSLSLPLGNATDANVNFVSTDYVEARGLKGNGTTKYLNTGLNISAFATNCAMSYAGTSLETSGDRVAMGTYDNNSNTGLCIADVYAGYVSGRSGRIGSAFSIVNSTASPMPTFERHYCVSRTSSRSLTLYSAGGVVARQTALNNTALLSGSHYVFCLNTQGTPNAYTAANLQMYSIGLGLTDSQVSLFSAAVVQFNQAMGRP